MRKKSFIFQFLLILLIGSVNAVDTPWEFETVAPAIYGEITGVNYETFIEKIVVDGETRYNLRRFDGEYVLQEELEIKFEPWNGHVVQVKRDGSWGLFSENGEVIVPCQYFVLYVNEGQCLAMEKEGVVNDWVSGWNGNRLLYDLSTGQATDVGFGQEFGMDGDFFIWYGNVENPGPITYEDHGTFLRAIGDAGQVVLDYQKDGDAYATLLPMGRNDAALVGNRNDQYDLYSIRGRHLYHSEYDIRAMSNGQYFFEWGTDQVQLRKYNGDLVIPFGQFAILKGNYSSTPYDKCAEDDQLIVMKEGRYGIVRLPETEPEPSDWAAEEVKLACDANLVDQDIRQWWRDNCTREEFCRILVHALEARTGTTINELTDGLETTAFEDTDEAAVGFAAQLGIAKGVGRNQFAPGKFITREEAATMLARAAGVLNIASAETGLDFADADTISDWASGGIATVAAITCGKDKSPLMQGTGNGNFSPQGKYTVEQAAITLYRLTQANV